MMSRFPRRADAVLFVALSLVTAALSAAAVVGSLASVGRTFPGFVVWDNLSPLQGRALSAAAHDDTRLYSSGVRQRFQLGDPSGLQKALQRLSDLVAQLLTLARVDVRACRNCLV